MKTTFDNRVSPPGNSPAAHAFAAITTWAVISPAVKFRVNPACPVAQNGHFIPQPAWDEIQTVVRSVYFINTDSTNTPSCNRQRSFRVLPPSQVIERTKVSNLGKNASAKGWRSSFGISLQDSGSSL